MADPKVKDHWSSEAYSASASFVPALTTKLLQYLDPKPTDRVLDIGCGDGKFTANFLPLVSYVLGIDASPAMIEYAQKTYSSDNKADFRVVDCRDLEAQRQILLADGNESKDGGWDKVISNAALHWILRDQNTRLSTLRGIYAALKPSGTFVFEAGGHGNIAEIVTAMISALIKRGLSISKAREAVPWFFPSDVWMKKTLEDIGFTVERVELEYRPTKLTGSEGGGGLEGWVRLMGAQMLDILPDQTQRDDVVKEVCEVLETVVTRDEDGSQWLGYVRLRGIARRV